VNEKFHASGMSARKRVRGQQERGRAKESKANGGGGREKGGKECARGTFRQWHDPD
jgi:hypothetical protein